MLSEKLLNGKLDPLGEPSKIDSHFIVRTNPYDDRGDKLLLKLLSDKWRILTATGSAKQVEYVLHNPNRYKPHDHRRSPKEFIFDTDIKRIANFIIANGTSATITGQLILNYYDLSRFLSEEQYKCILPEIVKELAEREEVAEVHVLDDTDVLDIQLYGQYCPNYEKLEGEE